jgi:hypothetical protein
VLGWVCLITVSNKVKINKDKNKEKEIKVHERRKKIPD